MNLQCRVARATAAASLPQLEQDNGRAPEVGAPLHHQSKLGIEAVGLRQAGEREPQIARLRVQVRKDLEPGGHLDLRPEGAGERNPGVGRRDGALQLAQPGPRGGELAQCIQLAGRIFDAGVVEPGLGEQGKRRQGVPESDLQHAEVGEGVPPVPLVLECLSRREHRKESPAGGVEVAQFHLDQADIAGGACHALRVGVPTGRGGGRIEEGERIPELSPRTRPRDPAR